jgi:hypothetical protein
MKNIYNILVYAKRSEVPRSFNFPSDESDDSDLILNKPGNESSVIDPNGSSGYGHKERKGYPEGISVMQENDHSDIPVDKDPDLPFGTDPQSEYGEGIISDNGLALHDDVNTYGEEQSPLGIHETLKRNEGSLNGGHGIFNMKKRRNIYERVSRDRNI